MSRSLRTDGRSVGNDKIDSWSEVTLGLCAISVVTTVLILFSYFVVELALMPFVQRLEAGPANTTTVTTTTTTTATLGKDGAISMEWFRQQLRDHNSQGFSGWDANSDGKMSEAEFVTGTREFDPPLKHDKAVRAYKFFNKCNNGQELLNEDQWDKALASASFHSDDYQCTPTTTPSAWSPGHFWKEINYTTLHRIRLECDEMDLGGMTQKPDHKVIQFDEFQAYVELKFGIRGVEALHLFQALDLNRNDHISLEECHENLNKLKKAVDGLGSPSTIIADMDMNEDGRLNVSEFSRLGEMLYLDNAHALGKDRAEQFFWRLDKDGNGVVAEELNYSLLPTPAPTMPPTGKSSAGGAAAQHPGPASVPDSAGPLDEGDDVNPRDFQSYRDGSAVLHGRTTIDFYVPKNMRVPPQHNVGLQVWPVFKSSFVQSMKTPPLKLGTITAVHISEASLSEKEGKPAAQLPYVLEEVSITWELDAKHAGNVQERIRQDAHVFRKRMLDQMRASAIPWLGAAEARMNVRITAQYYGIESIGLPVGAALVQHFGWGHGNSLTNTPIRVLPQTDVSLRKLAALVI